MDYLNNARISVFSKEEEDSEKIKEGLIDIIAIDLKSEKINVSKQTAIGFNESKIMIFEIFLDKKRHLKVFLNNLLNLLSDEQKKLLLKQVESRLDENMFFFIRFDKDRWIKNREVYITDKGNCFHIKLSISSYPKKREIALNNLTLLFSE